MLTEQDYQDAANQLGVDVPAIKAVAEVESGPYGAFLPTGEPVILFERHKFHKFTNGKYDASHPDISNRKAGGYGKVSEQHGRLARAVELDRAAALQSASWGRFQIMGFNYEEAGYDNLQDFINAMYRSEADHLKAFCEFVRSQGLLKYLKNHQWALFARGYNGADYRINSYDTRLAAAYRKHGGR